MADANLNINLKTNAGDVKQELTLVNGEIHNTINNINQSNNAIKDNVMNFNKWGMAIEYAKKAYDILKKAVVDCYKAYEVQAQAEVKLQAVLRATNYSIGMSKEELKDLASSLQNVTTFGDETIITVEQLLIQTNSLSKEIMPQAVETVLDMATAMGVDATSAANVLARALADPISSLRTLRTYGINFTDAEKEQITTLIEANKQLDAQKIVLEKLKGAYGGIAREIADTDIGKIKQLSNAWGDLKESVGGLFMEMGMGELAESATNAVKQATENITNFKATRDAQTKSNQQGASSLQKEELERLINQKNDIYNFDENGNPTTNTNTGGIREVVQEWKELNRAYQDILKQEEWKRRTAQVAQTDEYKKQVETFTKPPQEEVKIEEEVIQEVRIKLKCDKHDEEFVNGKCPKCEAEQKRSFEDLMSEAYQKTAPILNAFNNLISNIGSMISSLYQSQITELENTLDKMRDEWEKYYEKLEERQKEQRSILLENYAFGRISAEEYYEAIKKLDDEENEAIEENTRKEEDAQKRLNELKKKQFDAEKANNIAQATINTATGIMSAWAQGPIVGAIQSAIIAAAGAVQIATISAQQCTPSLATGGIATAPVTATIGDSGSPEMILPLNKAESLGYTLGGKSTNYYITVNVENSFTGDDLAKNVYDGIKKLKRDGIIEEESEVA